MDRPTMVQARVLRAVTTQAVEIRRMVLEDRARESGRQTQDALWFRQRDALVLSQTKLIAVATAAGIASEWVEQARERGELGMRWDPDITWRAHEPVDRAALVENLAADVQQLQHIAAVVAAHRDSGAHGEMDARHRVSRNMNALVRRITAIAHILDVTAEEAQWLWGRGEAWLEVADTVRGADSATVAARWREFSRLNTATAGLQATVLQRAGINLPATRNPAPTVASMVRRFQGMLNEPSQPSGAPLDLDRGPGPDRTVRFSDGGGRRITESVHAALGGEDLRPVFRSAADRAPQPLSGLRTLDSGYEP